MNAFSLIGFVGLGLVAASHGASAQESKSAPLARQLVAALEAAKLDSIAAKDPAAADVFIGALYIPGAQLLVISGQYAAPSLLSDRLARKEYRDIYIDLNGAATPSTRVFVEDLGADGLQSKNDDRPPDSIEAIGKRTTLDHDWKRQKLSEDDYMKAFGTVDARYAQMLTALLNQIKP